MAITATVYGGSVMLSGNPIWVKVSGGTAPDGSREYKYTLKIEDQGTTLIGSPFIDAISPDAAGEAMFDISGYLDQPTDDTFEYPPVTAVIEHTTQLIQIVVTPGERYIDSNAELQETEGTPATAFQVLRGGLSQRQIAIWYGVSKSFYTEYLQGKKFLSQRPSGDLVHPDQPVKLWYIPISAQSVKLKVVCYFNDLSSSVYESDAFTLSLTKLYEFNVNPSDLGIDIDTEDKQAVYFTVTLTRSGVTYTEERSFYYDWNYCERPFYLMFKNSLGGIDDVFMSGYAVESYETSGTVIKRPAEMDDTVYEGTLINPDKSGQNTFKLNTGWKTKTQMRHLRDLLVSRKVWLLYPNLAITSYTVIPIVIAGMSNELIDYKNDLHSCMVEISEAHVEQYVFDNRLF